MRRPSGVRAIAGVAAAVGWAALGLQLVLMVRTYGAGEGIWRYFGFFTVLSNIGVAAIATAVAAGRENVLTGDRARLMGLTAIVTVGFFYSILLRSLWNPPGLQKLAGIGLHDATPILFALLWAMMPHGRLRAKDVAWALVPPAVYLAYALVRGSVDGWYPYYFLDPASQSTAQLMAGIGGVLAAFAIIGGLAIALDARLPRRDGREAG